MASIRNLKKDINYVLGDIIDAVYFTGKMQTEGGKALVTEILNDFDTLIDKVADKTVENRGAHLKQVRRDFEQKAGALIEKLNALP
ncbi:MULTISPECIES: hypothetical protein [Capnocytophaga]|jgi:hypothetical protein|uniref:Uncharacterized protein n=1 Tax=Capnocytophaga ochracea TaxID=1018 RepID=A0A2X2T306_CAPOC|nr:MULTISPECIES: hypothetical protein [Capnocytophaga]EIW91018.1 hypothetical protein HMPREF1321_0584 [Capnocytophaga sp. oral taxon 412 str. F0487]EKY05707.1 hypothetical protein HMPREF9078_01701 [Capnocytophaga sp. oral taxon 380 str. F0488]EKY11394.1 hypothetical protein HMPREF9072_02409 [Capnocytophaga sp. oral taxon 324 str. F0483]NWO29705.1 hypothetical protein [Capnocytophaga sp. oral taxon 903]SQA94863.1 Uncharacterised protein [Capnocytophaga ochracea]